MSDAWGGLTLELHDYDADPKGDWLGFRAAVASSGFAGRTSFWVAREDLEHFARRLADLDESLQSNAELVCGVGDKEAIRVRLGPADGSGRLLVQVELSEAPTDEPRHRVQLEFRVMPNTLTAFRRELQSLLDRRAPGMARLLGDREVSKRDDG